MNKKIVAVLTALLLCVVMIVPAFAVEETDLYGETITEFAPTYDVEVYDSLPEEDTEEVVYDAELYGTAEMPEILYNTMDAGQTYYSSDRTMPLLVDEADLLTDAEEADLSDLLESYGLSCGNEIVIVLVNSTNGKTAQAFADDYYDLYNYGYGDGDDGLLLLISMENREWAVSTYGAPMELLSVSEIDGIMGYIGSDLSDGNYQAALTSFVYVVSDALTNGGVDENTYSVDAPSKLFSLKRLLGALVIGFLIAFIALKVVAGKLKSVKAQKDADSYIRPGSMNVAVAYDHFLYSNVKRTAKPKNTGSSSGSHTSSSGRSHGGSSGHF